MNNKFPDSAPSISQWPGDGNYAWQIWILRESGTTTRSELLYSWVTPAAVTKTGWLPSENEYSESIIKDGKTTKVNVLKATFYGHAATVQYMINGLLEGKFVSDIISDADGSFPPNEFLNFRLGEPAGIKKNYQARPDIFLAPSSLTERWDLRAIPSPTNFSCFVKQIFYIGKAEHLLFKLASEYTLATLIKDIAKAFRASSGFDLTKDSAPRLGNIEWFHVPLSNQYLSPYLSFYVLDSENGDGKVVRVKLSPNPAISQTKKVLISCRLKNKREVILDLLVEEEWGPIEKEIEFKAEEAISKVRLTVWEKGDDPKVSILLFEQECTLMRSITMNSSIVSSTIKTGRLRLLDKLRAKEADEAEKLTTYHRSVNTDSVTIGNPESDPWNTSSEEIKSIMAGLFPDQSEGRFFKNGWDDSSDESGQLSFVKWMLEIISSRENCDIILLDPFLDAAAIELFSRARTINARYTLLTCTQHREKVDGDEPNLPGDEPTAAVKIKQHCKLHEALLEGLDLTIFDLRNADGGKKPLFHDRYILIVDQSGSVIKGFHLSNSIQGATRTAPLLITPIPVDILPEVKEYVDGLLPSGTTPQPSGRRTVPVQLYPGQDTQANEAPATGNSEDFHEEVLQSKTIKAVEAGRKIFAFFFNDPGIVGISEEEYIRLLQEKGMISSDWGNLELFHLPPEALARFASALDTVDQEEFEAYWSAWANLLANSIYWNGSGYNVSNELSNALSSTRTVCDKLIALLKKYDKEETLITDRRRLFSMFQGEKFEHILENVLFKLMYFPADLFNLSYCLHYACKFLVYTFPRPAASLLEKLVKYLTACQWDESYPEVRARMLLTNGLVYNFFSYKNRQDFQVQQLLFKSELFSLRAAGACALLFTLNDQDARENTGQAVKTLDFLRENLCDEEYRLSIAYLISCRIIQQDNNIDFLYQKLTEGWRGNDSLVNRTVVVLSGRLWANHSAIITDLFLAPISKNGLIPLAFAFDNWNDVFKQKISSLPASVETIPLNSMIDKSAGFVFNTDIELTGCLIELTGRLNSDQQDNAIKEWIAFIKPSLQLISQPFAKQAKYHHFDEGCTRIYWVNFVFNELVRQGLLAVAALQTAESFFEDYREERILVETYIADKGNTSIRSLSLYKKVQCS